MDFKDEKNIYVRYRVLCRAAPRRQIKIKMQILPGAMVLGTSTVFRIQSMFKSTSALVRYNLHFVMHDISLKLTRFPSSFLPHHYDLWSVSSPSLFALLTTMLHQTISFHHCPPSFLSKADPLHLSLIHP